MTDSPTPTDDEGFSLEELGKAYADAVGQPVADEESPSEDSDAPAVDAEMPELWSEADGEEIDDRAATPAAIIEAALFVGQPNGEGFTPERIASLMRDITAAEVADTIAELNESYRKNRQGIRIAETDGRFRMVVAPEVESVRRGFVGKVRETTLSQASIEVLSLVAYQAGITAGEVTDRRGKDSGALLNQLVGRRLLEARREPDPASPNGKMMTHYYPAERLWVLLGLESADDLPHVEEANWLETQ